jgi:preprotein translocase subunit SecA
MDDDIMRIFGGETVKGLMETLKLPDDIPIENSVVSRAIESAQKKIEGHNFDIRHHLVEYDDVMNHHREIIYSRRLKILTSKDIKIDIVDLILQEAESIVEACTISKNYEEWDIQGIIDNVYAMVGNESKKEVLNLEILKKIYEKKDLIEEIKKYCLQEYDAKEKSMPDYKNESGSIILRELENMVYLRTIDMLWMDHMTQMNDLRSSVALSGYGQRDPLIVYKTEAYYMFEKLLQNIQSQSVQALFKINVKKEEVVRRLQALPQIKNLQTNENEIENQLTGDLENIEKGDLKDIVASNPVIIKTGANQSSEKFQKIGRNDSCPCGSGKKFKKCCGVL